MPWEFRKHIGYYPASAYFSKPQESPTGKWWNTNPITKERREKPSDWTAEMLIKAMDDAGLGNDTVDAVYVANMGGGMLPHQASIASSLVDRLSLLPAAAETNENGPASGASAVKNGGLAIASGYYDTVLVAGGEKMREVTGWRATDLWPP